MSSARSPLQTYDFVTGQLISLETCEVYEFDADYNGAVVAEDKHPDLEPYLGLHYPATDIPAQARALYLRHGVRHIPQVAYAPVPIVPQLNPRTGQPVDLTYADLRSFSPAHREYLLNMGVGASLTVSLVVHGRLWGLISAHHRQARHLPLTTRLLAETLEHMASAQLALRLDEALLQARNAYRQRLRELSQHMQHSASWPEALCSGPVTVRDVVVCGGAAVCAGGEVRRLGNTPLELDIRELACWLSATSAAPVFATDHLGQHYPPAVHWADTASGLLAVSLTADGDYALWFRPEAPQTISWGGDPNRVATLTLDDRNQPILHPRRSFAVWQETMRGIARPWQAWELEAAADLRVLTLDMAARAASELRLRAEALARFNAELQKSNAELDAFAYMASHDLREPLRGIHNYAAFLLEDYAAQLDAAGQHKLQTLVRLARRMETLVDSLLHYSRVWRLELSRHTVNVHELVLDVLDDLRPRLEASQVQVRVPRPLPTVRCDPVRASEVFANLLTNAIKYRSADQSERWVEVGYLTAAERGVAGPAVVFYVRDNGLGIAPAQHDAVFQVFKRLHPQDAYGGGAGLGLAIVKKIIERHQGSIWLESQLGRGATFYFTFGTDRA